jgi:hypothetical protein
VTITHKVETITPAIAEKILETNTKNRKLSSSIVTKLAEQMKNGQWNFDGTPIRIDDAGDLVDGQHRLWAVVESGTPTDFLVVRGVDEKAMATMDTGKSRTFADILSMEDRSLKSATNVAATTGLLYRWHRGARGSGLRSANANFVPHPELLEFFRENKEEIIEVCRIGGNFARGTGAAQSAFALCVWLFYKIDKEDAEYFFERVRDGVGLDAGSPILALKNWLTKSFTQRPRPHLEFSIAMMIKAWNAYRQGQEVQILTWKRGGSNPEVFPLPE